MPQEEIDGRRARGDESRRAILSRAVHTASVEGLDGLTIGRLAEATGHSKSGIATLFGSKEQLQLATVAAARQIFIDTVIAPARSETPQGLRRLCALLTAWFSYSRERVFLGGCFFAAASVEVDAKPGPVRDAIAEATTAWEGYLAICAEHAAAAGELPSLDDARQLAFELTAILEAANTRSLLHAHEEPYRRAATAVRTRLQAAGADAALTATIDAG